MFVNFEAGRMSVVWRRSVQLLFGRFRQVTSSMPFFMSGSGPPHLRSCTMKTLDSAAPPQTF